MECLQCIHVHVIRDKQLYLTCQQGLIISYNRVSVSVSESNVYVGVYLEGIP